MGKAEVILENRAHALEGDKASPELGSNLDTLSVSDKADKESLSERLAQTQERIENDVILNNATDRNVLTSQSFAKILESINLLPSHTQTAHNQRLESIRQEFDRENLVARDSQKQSEKEKRRIENFNLPKEVNNLSKDHELNQKLLDALKALKQDLEDRALPSHNLDIFIEELESKLTLDQAGDETLFSTEPSHDQRDSLQQVLAEERETTTKVKHSAAQIEQAVIEYARARGSSAANIAFASEQQAAMVLEANQIAQKIHDCWGGMWNDDEEGIFEALRFQPPAMMELIEAAYARKFESSLWDDLKSGLSSGEYARATKFKQATSENYMRVGFEDLPLSDLDPREHTPESRHYLELSTDISQLDTLDREFDKYLRDNIETILSEKDMVSRIQECVETLQEKTLTARDLSLRLASLSKSPAHYKDEIIELVLAAGAEELMLANAEFEDLTERSLVHFLRESFGAEDMIVRYAEQRIQKAKSFVGSDQSYSQLEIERTAADHAARGAAIDLHLRALLEEREVSDFELERQVQALRTSYPGAELSTSDSRTLINSHRKEVTEQLTFLVSETRDRNIIKSLFQNAVENLIEDPNYGTAESILAELEVIGNQISRRFSPEQQLRLHYLLDGGDAGPAILSQMVAARTYSVDSAQASAEASKYIDRESFMPSFQAALEDCKTLVEASATSNAKSECEVILAEFDKLAHEKDDYYLFQEADSALARLREMSAADPRLYQELSKLRAQLGIRAQALDLSRYSGISVDTSSSSARQTISDCYASLGYSGEALNHKVDLLIQGSKATLAQSKLAEMEQDFLKLEAYYIEDGQVKIPVLKDFDNPQSKIRAGKADEFIKTATLSYRALGYKGDELTEKVGAFIHQLEAKHSEARFSEEQLAFSLMRRGQADTAQLIDAIQTDEQQGFTVYTSDNIELEALYRKILNRYTPGWEQREALSVEARLEHFDDMLECGQIGPLEAHYLKGELLSEQDRLEQSSDAKIEKLHHLVQRTLGQIGHDLRQPANLERLLQSDDFQQAYALSRGAIPYAEQVMDYFAGEVPEQAEARKLFTWQVKQALEYSERYIQDYRERLREREKHRLGGNLGLAAHTFGQFGRETVRAVTLGKVDTQEVFADWHSTDFYDRADRYVSQDSAWNIAYSATGFAGNVAGYYMTVATGAGLVGRMGGLSSLRAGRFMYGNYIASGVTMGTYGALYDTGYKRTWGNRARAFLTDGAVGFIAPAVATWLKGPLFNLRKPASTKYIRHKLTEMTAWTATDHLVHRFSDGDIGVMRSAEMAAFSLLFSGRAKAQTAQVQQQAKQPAPNTTSSKAKSSPKKPASKVNEAQIEAQVKEAVAKQASAKPQQTTPVELVSSPRSSYGFLRPRSAFQKRVAGFLLAGMSFMPAPATASVKASNLGARTTTIEASYAPSAQSAATVSVKPAVSTTTVKKVHSVSTTTKAQAKPTQTVKKAEKIQRAASSSVKQASPKVESKRVSTGETIQVRPQVEQVTSQTEVSTEAAKASVQKEQQIVQEAQQVLEQQRKADQKSKEEKERAKAHRTRSYGGLQENETKSPLEQIRAEALEENLAEQRLEENDSTEFDLFRKKLSDPRETKINIRRKVVKVNGKEVVVDVVDEENSGSREYDSGIEAEGG